MVEQTCTECGASKALDEFNKARTGRNGKRGKCRECERVEKSRWYQNNKARHDRRQLGYRLRDKYGLTLDEYEQLCLSQGGVCAICAEPDKRQRLSVDHDHITGRVRGLLCVYCNNVLGQARDRVDVLRRAIKYLEA